MPLGRDHSEKENRGREGGRSNKGKGPLAAADRKLLEVGGPKLCSTVEQHVVSDLVEMEKTLPFTLAESWDKETWGLHTVY